MTSVPPGVRCPSCAELVPDTTYCVRCGHPLRADRRRRGFAAAPHEHRLAPSVVSTLFPQLPRRSHDHFRLALGAAVALLVGLASLRLFSLGLVAAAATFPLLVAIYLYDVNLYEDEPLRVVLTTMGTGALCGAAVGALEHRLFPGAVSLVHDSAQRRLWLLGVVLPLFGLTLMLAGPFLLLRYPRFNDILDGATFGAASAASFVSAQLLVASGAIFRVGLRPIGSIAPWIVRLLELGIVLPLVATGAVGACAATFWLHSDATSRARRRLDPRLVALGGAGALVLGAALVQVYLSWTLALAPLVALGVVATFWLRQLIHIGLTQDVLAFPVGVTIQCANCGRPTPLHSFCGACGIALRALPKQRTSAVEEAAST